MAEMFQASGAVSTVIKNSNETLVAEIINLASVMQQPGDGLLHHLWWVSAAVSDIHDTSGDHSLCFADSQVEVHLLCADV